jgi:hypothetical protein
MYLNKTHKTRTIIIIVVIVLFVLGGGAMFYWYNLTQTSTNDLPNQPATNSSEQVNSENSANRETDKDPLQNDSAGVNQGGLTAYITAKNVVDGQLQIRVLIEQYLSSGDCQITIGNFDSQVSVIQNPSSSSCAGWDIPLAQLGSGRQAITISITSDDKSVAITDEASL